jgi:hypothetical protein
MRRSAPDRAAPLLPTPSGSHPSRTPRTGRIVVGLSTLQLPPAVRHGIRALIAGALPRLCLDIWCDWPSKVTVHQRNAPISHGKRRQVKRQAQLPISVVFPEPGILSRPSKSSSPALRSRRRRNDAGLVEGSECVVTIWQDKGVCKGITLDCARVRWPM